MIYNMTVYCERSETSGGYMFNRLFIIAAYAISSVVFATSSDDGNNFGDMATTVTDQMDSFAALLVAAAFVAGIAFVIVALFKFKQHKDNPTQVTIGTPAMLLFIGIFLVYLPNIIDVGGNTVGGGEMGTVGGGSETLGVTGATGSSDTQ